MEVGRNQSLRRDPGGAKLARELNFMDEITKGDAPEFLSREEFEAWLQGRPREWSAVLAARAALRVLPVVSSIASSRKLNRDSRSLVDFLHLTSAVFYVTVVGWVAAKYPTRPINHAVVGVAEDSSAAAFSLNAANTAAHACVAINTTEAAFAAANAAAYASDAAAAYAGDPFAAIDSWNALVARVIGTAGIGISA